MKRDLDHEIFLLVDDIWNLEYDLLEISHLLILLEVENDKSLPMDYFANLPLLRFEFEHTPLGWSFTDEGGA